MLASSSLARHQVNRGGAPAAGAPETALLQALDRAVRAGRATTVLLVNLSGITPPGPRPHHRRVCRALVDLAAQSHSGQVFTCANGDVVLLGSPEPTAVLVSTLLRMFRAEAPGNEALLTLWTVPGEEESVRNHLLSMRATPPVIAEDPPAPIGAMAAVGALLASAPGGALMRRQTAVRIGDGGMSTLYQEVGFSLAALEERIGLPIPARADPYLFRHLAGQLDEQMFAALGRGERPAGRSLHLNLTLPGILSAGFGLLASSAGASAPILGAELQFMEVVADLSRFAAARERLAAAGCRFVLDGVEFATLLHATPAALQPDLLKLEWSPRMPALSARDRRLVQRTVDALGPERVVLYRAETEAALAWGLANGIRCFQGRHVDAILGADRITTCRHAAYCSLRQCIDRAAACDALGRSGCRDLALLDAPMMSPAVRPADHLCAATLP